MIKIRAVPKLCHAAGGQEAGSLHRAGGSFAALNLSPKYLSDNRFLAETSAITQFAGRVFREGFRPRYEVRELLYQCYVIGY